MIEDVRRGSGHRRAQTLTMWATSETFEVRQAKKWRSIERLGHARVMPQPDAAIVRCDEKIYAGSVARSPTSRVPRNNGDVHSRRCNDDAVRTLDTTWAAAAVTAAGESRIAMWPDAECRHQD